MFPGIRMCSTFKVCRGIPVIDLSLEEIDTHSCQVQKQNNKRAINALCSFPPLDIMNILLLIWGWVSKWVRLWFRIFADANHLNHPTEPLKDNAHILRSMYRPNTYLYMYHALRVVLHFHSYIIHSLCIVWPEFKKSVVMFCKSAICWRRDFSIYNSSIFTLSTVRLFRKPSSHFILRIFRNCFKIRINFTLSFWFWYLTVTIASKHFWYITTEVWSPSWESLL